MNADRRPDEPSLSTQQGLALIEAFHCIRDARLRQSLIVLARALAAGDVGPEDLRRYHRRHGASGPWPLKRIVMTPPPWVTAFQYPDCPKSSRPRHARPRRSAGRDVPGPLFGDPGHSQVPRHPPPTSNAMTRSRSRHTVGARIGGSAAKAPPRLLDRIEMETVVTDGVAKTQYLVTKQKKPHNGAC